MLSEVELCLHDHRSHSAYYRHPVRRSFSHNLPHPHSARYDSNQPIYQARSHGDLGAAATRNYFLPPPPPKKKLTNTSSNKVCVVNMHSNYSCIAKGRTARGRKSGGSGKNWGMITKIGGNKGHQTSHDFWGWQNCSPPRAPITDATPLIMT